MRLFVIIDFRLCLFGLVAVGFGYVLYVDLRVALDVATTNLLLSSQYPSVFMVR